MGVQTRIVLWARSEAAAQGAAAAAFRRVDDLEQIMSDYRAHSELMQLCARAGGPPERVSRELFEVLSRSQDLSRRSLGAFDVTVGPSVALWRAARKTGEFPSHTALARARAVSGWRRVTLDRYERSVRLGVPGMKLDLGGIAKGCACDAALSALKKKGIRSALVEMGGDIAVSAAPPGEKGWKIEIPGGEALVLTNCGVSTSGDLYQYVEFGGKRYSHIVDPRTGLGLTSRIEVTVIAADATTSDSLATAISVLGEKDGRALVSDTSIRLFIRTAQ